MMLSELLNCFPELKVLRDSSFNSTGIIGTTHDANILSYITDEKYIDALSGKISCVITTKESAENIQGNIGIALAGNPKEVFYNIHNNLSETYESSNEKTVLGRNCSISSKAIISDSNVVVGDNVTIEGNAIVESGSIIGSNCVLRSGSIIGCDGFQLFETEGGIAFVKHYGGVKINDNVEIQHNTIVEKAIWKNDSTVIGSYSKIGSLTMVGHGVKIGNNCIVTTGVVIGGSVVIGDNVYLGINSSIKHHLKIGSNVMVGMGAAVMSDVSDNITVAGNPARKLSVRQG